MYGWFGGGAVNVFFPSGSINRLRQIFERFFCSINRNSFLYEIVAAVANIQHMHKSMYFYNLKMI